MSGSTPEDLSRLDDMIELQSKIFLDRTTESQRIRAEAGSVLAGGVASSWQDAQPGTVWIREGKGSRTWDVDGTEYTDLHGGFGVGIVGHAHPAIVAAVSERVRRGTHFAQPTEDAVVVARELSARYGLPIWRYNNSGTESTMDAIHLMRVATGRPKIIKVEGTYHGHHDSVQVSVYPAPEKAGPAERPNSVPVGPAYPQEVVRLTVVVPFGDLAAVERVLTENAGQIAGMIIEPVMMNIGLIPPPPGYLAALKDLLHAHGAYLAFDEVKTGLALSPAGAVGLTGVTPDLVCLAKALGGGLPCGAIGGIPELMDLITQGAYEQVGTFNGNPLTMAAARAVLQDILTPEAYSGFDTLRRTMTEGAEEILRRYELPGFVRSFGCKGAVLFTDRLENYRDFLAYDDQWGNAHWLYQHNGSVFLPPWGKCEQWTASVQHTDEDAQRFLANLERMAADLRGGVRPKGAQA
ncbi:aspartate aminotransferase family protein [Streptacidiphilus rugosus]|uniref:aspartate aminotransferase family protein n=1 Tax=Streptacidiphilus rugosus TaxID=405783 RepID=UPI00055A48B6|nr:aminotransferase class III-fold pyridoxal phosphate-dependent enzyme [Streptacidiphilus rugosus]